MRNLVHMSSRKLDTFFQEKKASFAQNVLGFHDYETVFNVEEILIETLPRFHFFLETTLELFRITTYYFRNTYWIYFWEDMNALLNVYNQEKINNLFFLVDEITIDKANGIRRLSKWHFVFSQHLDGIICEL